MVPPLDGRSGPGRGGDECGAPAASWPPSFPHREIDALIDRLEESADTTDRAEAYDLLVLVAREAQRLRATAMRLVSDKLSAADREAQQIVAQALDESERLMAAVRASVRVQARAAAGGRSGSCAEPIRAIRDQPPGPAH